MEIEDEDLLLKSILFFKDAPSSQKSTEFISKLLKALKLNVHKKWKTNTFFKVLEFFKDISRIPDLSQNILTDEFVVELCRHATLSDGLEFLDYDCSIEALKCLSNCLTLNMDFKYLIIEEKVDLNIYLALKDNKTSTTATFLLIRILFFLTILNDPYTKTAIEKHDLPTTLFNIFESLLKSPSFSKNETETNIISDILKTFYTLTHDPTTQPYQSHETPRERQIELEYDRAKSMTPYKNWIPLITTLLTTFPLLPTPPLASPHQFAINAILNFPILPFLSEFATFDFIDPLLEILSQTVLFAFPNPEIDEDCVVVNGANPDEALTPLVLLLCAVGKWGGEVVRRKIRERVFPKDVDRSVALDRQRTVGARFIAFMSCGSTPNLKAVGSEFMYICFDENSHNLVAYTGYGHAAGFLFERGLGSAPPDKSTEVLDEESGRKIDSITGLWEKEKKVEVEMSEEEKEREAEKLMVLMDRLNKQGVIKTVMKEKT